MRDDAVPVVGFDDKLRTIIDDLIETMKQDVICIGLAAPQVGIGLQIAIVCMDRDFANAKIIINPTNVIELGKKTQSVNRVCHYLIKVVMSKDTKTQCRCNDCRR